MQLKNRDWKGLYELLNDLLRTDTVETLLYEFESNIDGLVPADRGAPMFEISAGRPICIRWPEYSSCLIREFNTHFNDVCPVKYNFYINDFGPVDWNIYRNSEYDTDFNKPLDIGYSLGFGFKNRNNGKINILVLNRARRDRRFSEKDKSVLKLLMGGIEVLYNRQKDHTSELEDQIRGLEKIRGNSLLSSRELQICRLACCELSALEISGSLGISRRTVERHIENIYCKLNIRNRKELLRLVQAQNHSSFPDIESQYSS